MKPSKQFWSLFKFQSMSNPFIWFLPLVFGIPLLMPLIMGSVTSFYHPSFFTLLMNQNLFFVGIFGATVLAPEKFNLGAAMTYGYGTEFLLTRAVDRPVLYRVKAVFLFTLVLSLPFIAIVHSANSPDLIVSEYAKPVQQECLASVPGSNLLPASKGRSPTDISIPRGNVLVAEWQTWVFLVSAVTLQIVLLVLYPLKYARVIFWIFFFMLILAHLYQLSNLGTHTPSVNERCFFAFAAHPALFWSLTALIFILAQLWCERRFARLEQ